MLLLKAPDYERYIIYTKPEEIYRVRNDFIQNKEIIEQHQRFIDKMVEQFLKDIFK